MIKINSKNTMMQKEAFAAIGPLLRAALPYLARGANQWAKIYAVEKLVGLATDLVKKKGADAVAKTMLRSTTDNQDAYKLLRKYVSTGGEKTPEINKLIAALGAAGGSTREFGEAGPKKSLWSSISKALGGGLEERSSGSAARWNPSSELKLASAKN